MACGAGIQESVPDTGHSSVDQINETDKTSVLMEPMPANQESGNGSSDDATLPLEAGIRPAPELGPRYIRFYIINRGEQVLRVPLWNTPLEVPLSADVFLVQRAGVPVAYTGRLVKRDASQAPHIKLAAGEERQVEIDLSASYTMHESGPYQVRFRPLVIDGPSMLDLRTPVFVPDVMLALP